MKSRGVSVAGAFAKEVRGCSDRVEGRRWPAEKWQTKPVEFAWTILGVELWSFQVSFVEAIRDHRHITVAGGRKIGKDFAVAVGAIWWFSSFPKASVFMLAPTSKQLDGILYLEIRKLWSDAGRCVKCKRDDPGGPKPCPHSHLLSGKVGEKAFTGIKAPDFRQIIGSTAMSEGGLRGFSGTRVLAIEDEAADIKDQFDTALVGNLAGADCTRVLISNPTRTAGFFYRSWHEERELYHHIQQSSEKNPNVLEGRTVFPGLADKAWIREREVAWGRGTINWVANVDGTFPKAQHGQLFSLDAVKDAELRWEQEEDEDARLYVGWDVAGEEGTGDEIAWAPRRGLKVYAVETDRGLSYDKQMDRVEDYLDTYRTSRDRGEDSMPVVVIDRDGEAGSKAYEVARARAMMREGTAREFRVVGFRGGAPPQGKLGEVYRYCRDAMYGGLAGAFKDGLGIPEDLKLEAELVVMKWLDVERGRSQLIHKRDIKEILGRSPDRCDALALSTWGEKREAARAEDDAPSRAAEDQRPGEDAFAHRAERTFNPWAGLRPGRSGEDPDDD